MLAAERSSAWPEPARRRAPVSVGRRSVLIAPLWEFLGLFALLATYLVGGALYERASYAAMNFAGPIWLASVLGLGALRMARADPGSVWTALFWFRVSTATYYGFGTLFPLITNETTRAHLLGFFRFYSDDVAKLNILFVVGTIIVLAAANLYLLATARRHPPAPRKSGENSRAMLSAGLFFLVAGGTVKYLFSVPYAFGLTSFVLPGGVTQVGSFVYAAIFLLTAWSRENAKAAFPFVLGLVGLELLVSMLTFSKAEVLTTLIMFLLGLLRAKASPAKLVFAGVTVIATYMTIFPIITASRAELIHRYGGLAGGGFRERIEMVALAVGAPTQYEGSETTSVAMSRLSYVNQAAFAVHEYDAGRPGTTFMNVLAVFVPRILWPDKPIITRTSRDFNKAATGRSGSASSPGLYGEAYWNFGWWGMLLMVPLGALLAFLSRYAMNTMQSGMWLFFPVVLLTMRIGMRSDGFFVADVVGASIIAFALHVLLLIVGRILAAFRRAPPRRRRVPMRRYEPTIGPVSHHARFGARPTRFAAQPDG